MSGAGVWTAELSVPAWTARRFLPRPALALCAVAWLLAARLPFAAEAGAADVNAGLIRQGVWSLALLVGVPWFGLRTARLVQEWKSGEGAWMAGTRVTRARWAIWTVLGAAAAFALWVLPFAALAEYRGDGAGVRERWLASTRVQDALWFRAAQPRSFELQAPAGADRIHLRFLLAAPGDGGPEASLDLRLARANAPAQAVEGRHRIGDGARATLAVPPGSGALILSVERVGAGAVVALDGPEVAWFSSDGDAWTAAWSIARHACLGAAVSIAIALATAAWCSASTAGLAAIALPLIAAASDASSPWMPWSGARDALARAGDGTSVAGPGWQAVALAALALGLAGSSLHARRGLLGRGP